METGTVLWYNTKKGFGFIKISEEKQAFVHHSNIINKKLLHKNDKINCEVISGEKGLKAINVEVIK